MKVFITKIKSSAFTFSLLLLILSGCENELINVDNPQDYFDDYLLYSTFEGDAIGDWPDKALPGLPVGDELDYSSRAGFEIIADGSNKAVSVPEDAPIEFISRPSNFAGGTVSVRWAAKMMSHGTTSQGPYGFKRFLITTNSSVGNDTLVALQFEGNYLCVHKQPGDLGVWQFDDFAMKLNVNLPPAWQHSDGSAYNYDCEFVVDLNYTSKTFDLTVVLLDGGYAGSDPNNPLFEGPVIKVEDLPFYDATPSTSPTDPARPTLQVTDLAYWGDSPITMDYVTIRQTPRPTYTGPVRPPF